MLPATCTTRHRRTATRSRINGFLRSSARRCDAISLPVLGVLRPALHSFYTILETTCWRTLPCCSLCVRARSRGRLASPRSAAVRDAMSPLRARVENGRLHLDEPTELLEGTELELVVDDDGDGLTDHERQALHEALPTSWSSAEAGRSRPASALIDELRRRR